LIYPLIDLAGLGLVGLAAGFIDTIAGGGGLLTVPSLLLAGLPTIAALATNKLQSSAGTLTASLTMIHKKQVKLRAVAPVFAMSFVGSLAGCWLVQRIPPRHLDVVIPIVLAGIAIYFVLNRRAGEHPGRPRIARWIYRLCVVPAIGFYDGFLGPGTGSFFGLAGVALQGETLVAATAKAKLLNFASNLAALLAFLASGKIVWLVGLAMMAGQIAGAYLGAHVMIRGGARLIRPLIVVMCLGMLLRYVVQKGMLGL
jgi:uncharacterized membrane protein YfcA